MNPRVLLLGGVDPSGGAGISLDATVVAMHGGQPLPVPVILTAQNRAGFREAFPVPEPQWRAAFEAACDDGPVTAVKIGLLGDAASIAAVGIVLQSLAQSVPIVVDPVLSATTGGLDLGHDTVAAYREHLVPLATVVTPNLPEFAALFESDCRQALRLGAKALLVKGGHADRDPVEDVLFTRDGEHRFTRARLECGEVRGTGCALASALAVRLAQRVDMAAACRDAGEWLAARLARLGPAPVHGSPRVLPLSLPD